MIASTIVRLTVLTVVAVGAAVVFWPDGIGLLLGLAIFRLIALMIAAFPLSRLKPMTGLSAASGGQGDGGPPVGLGTG